MTRQADQITLRGIDPRIWRELQALAKRQGVSLNKAALGLLAKGAGMDRPDDGDRIGDSLDRWIGTWSEREANEFLDSVRSLDQIDAELWG